MVTQFLGHMLRGEDINLIDGGTQRRSFTYISDGIDALFEIIKNKDNLCDSKIFNLGNPTNDVSIKELAELMFKILKEFPEFSSQEIKSKIVEVSSEKYYGEGYEDMKRRLPSITTARELLGWSPEVGLEEALKKTMSFYIKNGSEQPK